ncbi:MAG: AAA family ATPase [Deltaproteobacteria bacterium RBG_16_71_12]|nr:MAG: AAA family ATPase [Deltaproteobacteria bacterium RBG_16_71_12]
MSSFVVPARYLRAAVEDDLRQRMVFIGGPRQVGKTTFAQALLPSYRPGHPAYLNWDDPVSRERLLNRQWPASEPLIILDEVHKYARWRNLLKGLYDTFKGQHRFLVTGSARLDVYRRGGDSLLGRYHYHRMHPLSLPELGHAAGAVDALLRFGGFPEPFLRQSERTLRRWHLERLSRIVREDLVDLERVRELSLVERLAEALPERVGSPLSVKHLARQLEVDFKTARHWIEILERLYFCFRIPPFGATKIRAVKKEQKLYLWDWSQVASPGARLENLVASHLLKWCHYLEDTEGYRMELRFLRDVDRRELDFVVLRDRKPLFAVECKAGERELSPHIPYFAARTPIPTFYQVHLGSTERTPMRGVHILPLEALCRREGLV